MPDGRQTYSSGNDKSYKICLGHALAQVLKNIVSKLSRRKYLDLYLSNLFVNMLGLIITIIVTMLDKK